MPRRLQRLSNRNRCFVHPLPSTITTTRIAPAAAGEKAYLQNGATPFGAMTPSQSIPDLKTTAESSANAKAVEMRATATSAPIAPASAVAPQAPAESASAAGTQSPA